MEPDLRETIQYGLALAVLAYVTLVAAMLLF